PAATLALYTLSLRDALPISGAAPGRRGPAAAGRAGPGAGAPGARGHLSPAGLERGSADVRPHHQPAPAGRRGGRGPGRAAGVRGDRKSTRLNSSHVKISYAV